MVRYAVEVVIAVYKRDHMLSSLTIQDVFNQMMDHEPLKQYTLSMESLPTIAWPIKKDEVEAWKAKGFSVFLDGMSLVVEVERAKVVIDVVPDKKILSGIALDQYWARPVMEALKPFLNSFTNVREVIDRIQDRTGI